jgi:hypothetical protein
LTWVKLARELPRLGTERYGRALGSERARGNPLAAGEGRLIERLEAISEDALTPGKRTLMFFWNRGRLDGSGRDLQKEQRGVSIRGVQCLHLCGRQRPARGFVSPPGITQGSVQLILNTGGSPHQQVERKSLVLQDDSDQKLGETIALLVLERGAEWPSWGTSIRLRAANSAVEVQMDSESNEEFQARVEARISNIAKKSMRLVAAGYACSLEGQGRRQSRKALCTRILTSLADGDGAELILAGGSWDTAGHEGKQRGELIELWGELSIQVPGRLVSVRFEDPPRESGVFRAAQNLMERSPNSDSFDLRSFTDRPTPGETRFSDVEATTSSHESPGP